ncbi:1-deoxy-D-xylulose-5-phosphate reductoisomerase [candidate division KSB1 bacterium]|nr:1-deoxy-D-xylulose-5-phosphate reductoisomerase [candidate division KSB1 bacterium]
MKSLLLQGATGSIGRSTLAVVREKSKRFRIAGIAAGSDLRGLLEIAAEFHVSSVALHDDAQAGELTAAAKQLGIDRVYVGPRALQEQVAAEYYDLLVNAVMGGAGLRTTMSALERGKSVALANKEALVAAGPLLMKTARAHGAAILPVDSEHSALYQCLLGERADSVRRLWLTSSGGPFWGMPWDSLDDVSVERALAHPTWKMGPKITIDSATLFNKGLEVIEAERLFGVDASRIRVLVHRQSVVHSMVEFVDGSFKAQLSVPDMRLPILFALTYPERATSDLVRTEFDRSFSLTFEPLTNELFPCLALAYAALAQGGTAPAALSAADEIAVPAFLRGEISFTAIARVIERVLARWTPRPLVDLETVEDADRMAREMATEEVQRVRSRASMKCC